jgi:hypothetical protein
LKNKHDVLDSSKTLRELGLQNCGVGQYLELEYHHPKYFPGLRGGRWTEEKLALKKQCEDAGIDWKAAGLSERSGAGLFRSLLREAQGPQSGQVSSRLFPGVKVMASEIRRSGIDRPPGQLDTMARSILEPLYQQAQAELAKEQTTRPRREATTKQSEEMKEEDVEMLDVKQIKLDTKEGEVLLKAEVEKLLVEADKAWTCAKIKFHDAFVDLHAIDATPARSMAWWCRSLAVLETSPARQRRRPSLTG